MERASAECGHTKPASRGPYERAVNVSVAGGAGSLPAALAAAGRRALITGGNRVVCEECTAAAGCGGGGGGVKRAFWERSHLERESLSNVLVFNLKRFTVQVANLLLFTVRAFSAR